MKIIKLDAIDSTNSFLKEMAVNTRLENFTIVTARAQNKGRGQMENTWFSEPGKNLTFSVFVRFNDLLFVNNKYLSFAVSLSVFEAIDYFNIPKLTIKWPNDIMSVNYKIGGILIENSLKKEKIVSSIIGIGLNVNQDKFNTELTKASSIKRVLGKELDLDNLLNRILERLEQNIQLLEDKEFQILEERYLSVLYRNNIPSMYKDKEGKLFMGKIIGVSQEGKLQLELEDETIKEFDLKEVSFV